MNPEVGDRRRVPPKCCVVNERPFGPHQFEAVLWTAAVEWLGTLEAEYIWGSQHSEFRGILEERL